MPARRKLTVTVLFRALLSLAGFVAFFLGLPVHMAVCSSIHAKMLRRPLSEGISVWLVEKSIKLGLISIGLGIVALLILASKA